jgi:hypothetical protein
MPIVDPREYFKVEWTEADLKPDHLNPNIRVIDSESSRHAQHVMERLVLAAETSLRTGGALPEARGYSLPPMVTGLDVLKMGRDAWEEMKAAATWLSRFNADACINLDHPDVKAAL